MEINKIDLKSLRNDALKKIKKSAFTQQIQDADKARDDTYIGMVEIAGAYMRHHDKDVSEAAQVRHHRHHNTEPANWQPPVAALCACNTMRTKFSKIALAAALGLAMTFTLSCSSGGDGDPTCGGRYYNPEYQRCLNGEIQNGAEITLPSSSGSNNQFNENSQIYNEDGSKYTGSGVIEIRLDSEDGDNLIKVGSVTNGIVNLDITSQIPDKYLKNIDRLYLFRYRANENEGCQISPEDTKIFQTDGFDLYDSEKKYIANFWAENYHDDDGNEYFLSYSYFTKAAKVTCDNKFKKFDIDAKAGWNKVYIKDPDSDYCKDGPNGKEVCKAIVSTNNFFTKEIKWVIYGDYGPDNNSPQTGVIHGTPVTYQGETYQTVVIGSQTWMARNLNYAADGSKCYDDEPANCDTYGRLYNWATAMALPSNCNSNSCASQINAKHRGICPSGWHIPSDVEWTTLTDFVGGSSTAETKLKATSGWNDYNGSSGNGTDEFGFSALPGGLRYSSGDFYRVGGLGHWWGASENGSGNAYSRSMPYDLDCMMGTKVSYYCHDKILLFSVRCLKD